MERSNLIIRPLEKRDVEFVGKIFDQYWADDFRNNLSSKLESYFQNDVVLKNQKFKFFVVEENGEIVGVDAIRNLPIHLKEYSSTSNPAELYVVAVKNIGKGVGKVLVSQKFELAKNEGYTEILLFSGETHQDSWKFYDKYFERLGHAIAPNNEQGYIWRKLLI